MATFLRYEKKFLINKEQHDSLLNELKDQLSFDEHTTNGKYKVYTIYFDDKDNDVLRHSVDRPIFKEKMRIRSYRECEKNDDVYLEIKKKYDGYGSKRRIKVSYNKALDFINRGIKPNVISKDENEATLNNQIINEFSNYLKNNKIKPFVFMSVDREAYYFTLDKDTRITFDSNVKYRFDDFDFKYNEKNKDLLDNDQYICEIKFKGAVPYELAKILSKYEIYRTRFSKVGQIYLRNNKEIINNILKNNKNGR